MKTRSREVNVFSMSALDLFASALGAFILISIVLMPYFLHLDPDEVAQLRRDLERTQDALEDTQQRLGQAQSENARLQRELEALLNAPKFQLPHLDVVMALDTTGSMREEVEGLRAEIAQFAELMLKLSPSLGIGVIDFKDRCEGPRAVRQLPLRLMDTGALSDLVAFTRTMTAGGSDCNKDRPEDLARALDAAVASSWRAESEARIIVIITDFPAYPEQEAHALATARGFAARGPQFNVSVVVRGDGGDFLEELAEAGNGKYVGSGASFTATMLLALVGV